MKKGFLINLVALFTIVGFASAQKVEVGAGVYGSQYFGDLREKLGSRNGLGDYMGYMVDHVNPGASIYLRYNVNTRLSFRTSVVWARISGDDKLSNEKANLTRNLSFRNDISEFNGMVEWNFRSFEYSRRGLGGKRFSPFLFGGVSLYHNNPKALFTYATGAEEWLALQPLSTEGQDLLFYPSRKRYDLTQFSFPVGVGLKFALNENWRLAIEAGYRITYNDYLDDVSTSYVSNDIIRANRGQLAADLADRRRELNPALELATDGTIRGDASNNDHYLLFGVTLGYTIFKDNCPKW